MGHAETFQRNRPEPAMAGRAMRAPLLSHERERELARRWREHGDSAAMNELVEAHSRLAVSVARRFRNYGVPMDDLVQEGHIGLMQAADRFDPDRGARFSTCAMWWVRAAIQDYVLRNWSVVRPSTTASQKSLFFGLPRYRARLNRGGADSMSPCQHGIVARSLGVQQDEVERMEYRLSGSDFSLNLPIHEDGHGEHQDLVPDSRDGPEAQVVGRREREDRLDRVREALGSLTRRERDIIRARHLTESPTTLERLGARFGVSKERVRQIEDRALAKLRTRVLALQDDGPAFEEDAGPAFGNIGPAFRGAWLAFQGAGLAFRAAGAPAHA